MNIDISKKVNTVQVTATTPSITKTKENDGKFAAELKSLENTKESKEVNTPVKAAEEPKNTADKTDKKEVKEVKTEPKKTEKTSEKQEKTVQQPQEEKNVQQKEEKTEVKPEKIEQSETSKNPFLKKEEFVNPNEIKIGDVKPIDEVVTPVIDEQDFIPEEAIKPAKELKAVIEQLEINPEKEIIKQEKEVVNIEPVKPEHIVPKEKETAKVDVKPEAQVSITKPDFEPEIDETAKPEKTAKHEKPQHQNSEIKTDKEKEGVFKNIIEETSAKDEIIKPKTQVDTAPEQAEEPETIEIDENIIKTAKFINGLEDTVKEIKKINRENTQTEPVTKQEAEPDKKVIEEKDIVTPKKIETEPKITVPETDRKPKISEKVEKVKNNKKEIKPEDKELIDNNINIQDVSEKNIPQMNANMNFNSNEQPFSEFVTPKKEELKSNQKDLAEEKAILSTMAENIAIANQNMININKQENTEVKTEAPVRTAAKPTKPAETILQTVLEDEPEEVQEVQSKTKTVTTDEGVKKVDRKTNVVVETVVKYDTVVMDKADVDFFSKLVNEGSVEMASVQHAEKSSHVSKTLADLLAKAMQENKPVRIDFDNDISVIIKIGKDGKISADFLPSSQVAEAYLKENLPLLKQKLDDNNIEYDELNQRKQKQDNQENRKKGRKDE